MTLTLTNKLFMTKTLILVSTTLPAETMTEFSKILWTSCATLIGGIIIFVTGRTIEKFILEPLQEYKKTLSSISYNLIYYSNIYSNVKSVSDENKVEVSLTLRKLASELSAKTHQIVFYKIFTWLKVIPNYNNSIEAVGTLIGFSNSLWNSELHEINDRREKIEQLLKIKSH